MAIILIVIGIFLFVGYAMLILYYRQCWLRVPSYQTPVTESEISAIEESIKITIIIPARDEEENIATCLQAIIGQTYPAGLLEVIVVDDHSTDKTAAIVQSFHQQNIRCIFLKDHVTDTINSYKKKAIEVAIAASSGNLIVTTDADCFMNKNWLQTIAEFYKTYRPAFIAAPVAINNGNSFLSIFQSLDFMTLQGITGASVHKKLHSMCNGANLAYEKKAFIEVGGFKGIDTIASGDDMLLMHKIFKRYPERVLFLKSKDTIVLTQPMLNWKSFFNQRIRWASKADKYNDKRILPVLMLVYFFNLFLLLLPVIALFAHSVFTIFFYQAPLFYYWLLLLFLKTIVELYFLYPLADFFGKKNILWWFPVAQPFHILYTVIAGWLGKFGSYQWKDRKVK